MTTAHDTRSLPEVHASVHVPSGSWLRRMLVFAGPAYLVSVGYMDPGNWATDLAGGARFGYRLIWVLLMSNLMAVLLQTLSARLGVVTGKDLAQACRDFYAPALTIPLWLLCEVAIIACDLAEVLGAAIGLQLLFGLPLIAGVLLTALDVLLMLGLPRLGMRRLEAVIITLVVTIGICFAAEMVPSRPDLAGILAGFLPRDAAGHAALFARGPEGPAVLGLSGTSLYIAMGILGATVMPHNLYLHSALVQSRAVADSEEAKREACRLNLVDSAVALNAAFFVNAAILVLAAATFHSTGHQDVARLEDAHRLLAPLLGTPIASTLFAVALLSSGQSSTITGTLAGQIVMEGFLRIRIQPWLRRLISRGLAIVPAVLVIALRGPGAVDGLLVLSQVVLSLQLAFAVVPLVTFTSDRSRMGRFVNPPWVVALAVLVTLIIIGLNANLVRQTLGEWLAAAGPRAPWLWATMLPPIAALTLLLAWLVLAPIAGRLAPALLRRTPDQVPAPSGGPAAHSLRTIAENVPYRRIAVALELAGPDRDILEHVRRMALPAAAELVLMHVAESAASRYLGTESSDAESREDRATLEALAAEFRARGLGASVMLGNGDVKSELARMVNASGIDLLITGSHGHGIVGDLFHGATTSGLRHRVQCPVLVVRSATRSHP